MQLFPSLTQKLVDKFGTVLQPWIAYLQQFTIPPPAFLDISVTASPFEYEAKEPGYISIIGGIVSAISLTRGADTIIVGTATRLLIPVAINDIVTVTYTVLPTIKFIPSYGQNTTS